MARKRNRNRTDFRSVPARRVISHNTNLPDYWLPRRIVVPLSFSPIEDHRRYHPHGVNRSLRALDGRRLVPSYRVHNTRARVASPRRPFPLFADLRTTRHLPRDAVICARRRIRKEVIFAMGQAGRRGQRRPRYNANSDLRCSK